ncbi:MAG: accessory gene regulator B family protein [Lachnospiraceae bacterium]|nr:accessory gene regulator B family protein [Lachnospiraceae bacterium]
MGEKYRNLIDKITYGLVADNTINSADVEAYKFGLEITILKAFHYVSYIAIALCMKKFLEFVIIFAVLYAFRRNTGGFHAKTRIGCYLFSCAVIFLSLFATGISFSWWGAAIISILDIIILLILSPVQNSNRNLDTEDIEYFRHRLRILSVIFLMVYIATIGLKTEYFITLYTIGLTMDTFLTILGKLQSIKQF